MLGCESSDRAHPGQAARGEAKAATAPRVVRLARERHSPDRIRVGEGQVYLLSEFGLLYVNTKLGLVEKVDPAVTPSSMLALSQDRQWLYALVADGQNQRVVKYDAVSREKLPTRSPPIEGLVKMFNVSHDGQHLFVGCDAPASLCVLREADLGVEWAMSPSAHVAAPWGTPEVKTG